MMGQYFEVGEEVLLRSVTHPELNGDAVVISVITDQESCDVFNARVNPHLIGKVRFIYMGDITYELDIAPPERACEYAERAISKWAQSALKKKQDNAGEFGYIMARLIAGRVPQFS